MSRYRALKRCCAIKGRGICKILNETPIFEDVDVYKVLKYLAAVYATLKAMVEVTQKKVRTLPNRINHDYAL